MSRWFIMLVLVLGCRGSPDEPEGESLFETFHPPDVAEPRETWVDGPSGLAFTTPGLGWNRLTGPELAALGPRVVLAVREGSRCTGWATVEDAGGRKPQAAADASRAALRWDGLEVQVDEAVKYDLWTARRYEVQGRLGGRTTVE